MSATNSEQQFWTVRELAKQFNKSQDSILGLIRSGKLKASNLGLGTQPRWYVADADLRDFLEQQSNRPEAKTAGRA